MIDMCVKTNNEGGEPPLNVQQQLHSPQEHLQQQHQQQLQSQQQQQLQLQQQMQLQHLQLQHHQQSQQLQQQQQPSSKKRRPLDDLPAAVAGDCKRIRMLSESQEISESQENQFPSLVPSLTQTPPVAHQQVTQTLPEDIIIPSPPARRRSLLMWNPRLRGKDERRKVLKISVLKLRAIEDPEIFLRRSVLVNNTLKKLQKEIRDERSSQRFYDVRNSWRPVAEETCLETIESPSKRRRDTETEELRQESSDEEIFGVSSDVVRVSVPKPASLASSSSSSSSSESEDESSEQTLHNSEGFNSQNASSRDSKEQSTVTCASQFRRLEDSVSVLDSVVYHSLIASLES